MLRATFLAFTVPLISWQFANASTPDVALCTVTQMPVSATILACPAGDGPTLAGESISISVTIRDNNGTPLMGVSEYDIWLDGTVATDLYACAGGTSPIHDTTYQGTTEWSGQLAAGGYTGKSAGRTDGQGTLTVFVMGAAIAASPLDLRMNSPDISGDGLVNLADTGLFSTDLSGPYNFRSDFDHNGVINLADTGIFSAHNGHACHP